MTDTTRRLVATAAAWGVASDLTPPSRPLPAAEWGACLAAATSERVLGTFVDATTSGAWAVTDDQHEALAQRHRAAMAAAVRLERELVEVGARSTARGIDLWVLKGPASAHLDYPDPSQRCFGDIDLLIGPHHIEAARDLLLADGGRRHFPEPRPGFDRRFTKGLSITTPHHLEIDLHRTLAAGPFGLAIAFDELTSAPDTFTVGATRFPALGRPQRFVHACYHAVLGASTPRLVPLRDLAATAPSGAGALADVLTLASSWRGEAVVAAAVRAAVRRLGWRADPALAAWAHARVDDRRELRWLRGYVGSGRAYATQAITAVEAVPGLRDKAAYLRAVALPDDASRGDALAARYRRGMRALARSVRGDRS